MHDRRSILVVDDEADIRSIVAMMLEDKDFAVLEASSGNEALEIFQREEVFAIFSDIRMDDGDGIELLRRIRSIDQSKPFICLMTGFTYKSEKEILDMGANAVFSKPLDFTLMMKTLNEYMDCLLK